MDERAPSPPCPRWAPAPPPRPFTPSLRPRPPRAPPLTSSLMRTLSAATGQRSLGDPAVTYPLWPPLTSGCPRTSTEETAYPVEVAYAYESIDPTLLASLFTSSLFTPTGPGPSPGPRRPQNRPH
ncbi:hypothetical protein GCM10009863_26050 [Streptomyces axinellae]|uniref:Uncharacterized protein n=1 Tax=Streptomyces axinellae TaxID=552788 RepID=A0ABP6CAW7_9ACTN